MTFEDIEQKILYPKGLNDKFDLYLDVIRKIPDEEKIFFTQNLGVMLKSGLSASRAFRTLTLQSSNPKLKRTLAKITRDIEKGQTISSSMQKYPKTFSAIFTSMIKAGEVSGQLEPVLKQLASQLKKTHELKSKVKGALMYPMAILIAMTAIGSGMLIFVIPKLTAVFSEMSVELPIPTRILIFISSTLNNNILIFGPLIIGIIGVLIWITRKGKGQRIWHAIILRLPVVGKIAIKINLSKISRTLSSLLATDMPIVQSLRLTSDVVDNAHYKNSLVSISERVENHRVDMRS